MSSPFKIFRKHQKVLLVVAGLMAMIAFVILPIVLENLSIRQGGANPLVATTTKYGGLKESDMKNLRARHECVLGVLSSMANRLFGMMDEQSIHDGLQNILGDSKEETLVNRWLMDKKADELGIQVSDASITDFLANNKTFVGFFMQDPQFARYLPFILQNKTPGKLTEKDFREIFARFGITESMFRDMLREELKVQEFQNTFFLSISGMTPGQRWNYYCRTQRRAKIECIPVKVEPFAAAITKPSEKTLEDYFKKYQDNVPLPFSPEPGFRVPQKIEVEYFAANVEDFAAPEKITEDEIQAYYDKDPKKYDEMNRKVLLSTPVKTDEKKEPAEKEGGKIESSDNAKPAEETKPAEDAKPAEVTKPAEETKPAEQAKPVEGDKPPAAPETEKKANEPTAPPAPEKPAENAEEKKSSSVERSPYRFASLQTEESKNPETPKPDAPKPGDEAAAPKTESSAEESKPAETKPAETKPAETAPATGEIPAKPQDSAAPPVAEPPKRELTEEVRKEIRQAIAADKIKGIFDKLGRLMKENAIEWKRYEAAKIHGATGLKKPLQLDFEGLAKQHGVAAGKTGRITRWEARDLDLGKSQLVESGQSFFLAAFDNLPKQSDIPNHAPVMTAGLKGEVFLFWKAQDVKETAPKWEDHAVRKQVLEAWQLEQARKPALEKAAKLAAEARKSKTTLKEAFAGIAGIEVVSPPSFAWLTGGLDPLNPRYDLNVEVQGVDLPGEEFMKTVFALNEGEIGTAMNLPQKIAYVIQAEKFEPAEEELWNRFKDSDFSSYADARRSDLQAGYRALLDNLAKEAGLEWKRKADQRENENTPAD
ncbi:MAG: hypothetical protein IT426_17970 [Pirellulales bacterium]|nr:hypothetical protein [Pirellulales bacterium]